MRRRRPSPSHYVSVAILQADAFVGVTAVSIDIDTEPTGPDGVDRLAERVTARARETGDLTPDRSYFVLSWQPFGGKR